MIVGPFNPATSLLITIQIIVDRTTGFFFRITSVALHSNEVDIRDSEFYYAIVELAPLASVIYQIMVTQELCSLRPTAFRHNHKYVNSRSKRVLKQIVETPRKKI